MTWNKKQWIKVLLTGLLIVCAAAYLFYDSLAAVPFLSPLLIIYLKGRKKNYCKERLKKLDFSFREALEGITAALLAGYSIENSFVEARKELLLLYDEDEDMVRELTHITEKIALNQRVEDLLLDFARRSQLENIQDFAEVFVLAKRSGGNLITILNRTAKNIGDRIEIAREIDTMAAAKRLEAGVMCLAPGGIITYMRLFSDGFMDQLYHNLTGIIIMSLVLFLYGAGIYLSERIANIEV